MTWRILINAMTATVQRQPVSTVCGGGRAHIWSAGKRCPRDTMWAQVPCGGPSESHHPLWRTFTQNSLLGLLWCLVTTQSEGKWWCEGAQQPQGEGRGITQGTQHGNSPNSPLLLQKSSRLTSRLLLFLLPPLFQQLSNLHFRSSFSFSPCWCFSDICNWALRPTLKLYIVWHLLLPISTIIFIITVHNLVILFIPPLSGLPTNLANSYFMTALKCAFLLLKPSPIPCLLY